MWNCSVTAKRFMGILKNNIALDEGCRQRKIPLARGDLQSSGNKFCPLSRPPGSHAVKRRVVFCRGSGPPGERLLHHSMFDVGCSTLDIGHSILIEYRTLNYCRSYWPGSTPPHPVGRGSPGDPRRRIDCGYRPIRPPAARNRGRESIESRTGERRVLQMLARETKTYLSSTQGITLSWLCDEKEFQLLLFLQSPTGDGRRPLNLRS